jgi:hypothetical protein
MDKDFFMQNTLSSQLLFLVNAFRDLNETWYKHRSQCVDMHITRGMLSLDLKEL